MTDQKTPIGVGYWRTRSGLKAYVAATNCPFGCLRKDLVAIGWVEEINNTRTGSWSEEGRYILEDETDWDLIEPWREPVKGEAWLVFSPEGGYPIDILTLSPGDNPNRYISLKQVYDWEVNAKIEWFWDGGYEVTMGDQANGWGEREWFVTIEEAIDYMYEQAKEKTAARR